MATPHKLRILFVDDERPLQEIMRAELPLFGHEVHVCGDGTSAVHAIQSAAFDVAILDLRLPDMTGIDVLRWLKEVSPDTDAIMMTGHGTQETAVEAMRLGAVDFLNKPCKMADIEAILLRLVERRRIKNQNLALQTRVQAAEGPGHLIGRSPAMAPVHQLIQTVAPTDSTVLILGETGTGKEMVARTLFECSHRAAGPFVPINCGALSETLVESLLFGHRRGAFTGAERDHKGLFEVANGGTVFLDELGELSKGIQVKLLRFLESGEIRRLGESQPIVLDVRVLCATNRNLWDMVHADQFRQDLLYRLNTFEIRLPPLRERLGDIAELAVNLLARTAKRPFQQVAPLLTAQALQAMVQYPWPGNVRELANAMEYAWIVSKGQPITEQHLPQTILRGNPRPAPAAPPPPGWQPHPAHAPQAPHGYAPPGYAPPGYAPAPAYYAPPQAPAATSPAARTLREMEMDAVLQALQRNGGNRQQTATELGIAVKTLYNKLKEYGYGGDERQPGFGT